MDSVTGTKPEHYERLNLTPNEIAAWEDGLRTDPDEPTFEWWYLDCALADGGTLIVEFHTKLPSASLRDPLTPFVTMTLNRPDGTDVTRVCLGEPAQFSASAERCDVRIGRNSFVGDLSRYELHLEFDDVSADIALHASVPAWRPATGHVFVDEDHYVAWLPSVPRGAVSGRLTLGGETTSLHGTGYHDHNWGNVPLSAAIDHWYWGHAQIGDYTVVALHFTSHPAHGEQLHPALMIATGDTVLAAGIDAQFVVADVRPHPDTGVSVAERLIGTCQNDDTTYEVEFNRDRDVFQIDFGESGAYHRFTGAATLTTRAGSRTETATGEALWELLSFAPRARDSLRHEVSAV